MEQLDRIVEFNEIAGNEVRPRGLDHPLVKMYLDLIEEEYQEILDGVESGSLKETLDGAGDLIVVAAGLIAALGYQPAEIVSIINDSNFSKACNNEVDAIKSVNSYAADERYIDVCYRKIGERYVIFGRKRGGPVDAFKILKGINYESPKITIKE